MVTEFVVVAESTTIRRTEQVEFARTTGNAFTNAFASSYNLVSFASADHILGE